ncbi:hypothetical protein [Hymenobacter negativus]|uniref:TonB C-terminal domain-containing protein n=1 Tax=Hymenobacter negativus TaxID=2795026 RepID=A0ABS3QKD7_9BACT|nr:hypothetical protein [Hymenobacter negativus]MBO2011155.1 hypothetical protein [Hymenobacter negativus]
MSFSYPSGLALAACLAGISVGASAQTVPVAAPRRVTIYLNAAGQQLATPDGADHRADITMRDSVSGIMREYFPSGKLWRVIPFAHVQLGIRHGVVMSYDETGKLRKREDFLAGRRQGEVQLFDASGTLTRQMTYDQGKRVAQQCFAPTGQAKACQEEKLPPVYPGGKAGLVKALEAAVVLPTEEIAKQGSGIVLVSLVVDAQANIIGAKVVNAPTANMGQAVVAAAKQILPFQAPGMVNQEPVSVLYTLSVKVGRPANGWNLSNAYTEVTPKVTYLDAE